MQNYNRLEQLLAQYSFEELPADQKEWVLLELSANEYDAMRHTILLSQQVNQPPAEQAGIGLPPSLEEAFDKQFPNKPSRLSQLTTYKVPLYQVAAAVVLGIILLVFFWPQPTVHTKEKIVYVPKIEYQELIQTDTVYKEKIIYKYIEVVKTQTDSNPSPEIPPMDIPFAIGEDNSQEEIQAELKEILNKTALSNKKESLAEQSQLLNFTVAID